MFRSYEKQKKNLESTVGKNLMGILASVLIFAGLTLLATAVYDSFTDVMRVIGLFLISAIMLTAGRLGMRKEKNAFFLSLTGCGVGAVYISLFLTYGYFGLINEIVLYLLLAVWSVVVYFIGGKGSQLFKIIGQLGILVSLVFGNVQFLDGNVTSEDVLLIYMLMIFYIATSAFYLFIEWKKGVAENLPALIINIIGTFFLYHAAGKLVNFIDVWAVVLTGYLIAAYLLMQVWVYVKQVETVFDKDKDSLGCWLFSSAALFVSFLGTLFLLPKGEEWVYGVCSLGFLLVFWLITEQRRKEDAVRTALLSEAFFYGVICCFTLDLVADIFGAAILALPLAVAAYLKKDGLYLTLSMVAFCIFAVFGGEYEAPYVLFVVIFVLLYFLIMLNRLEMYKQRYKILLYVGVLFTLFSATDKFDPVGLTHMEFQHVILYLGALICALATLTDYSKSWVEKGKIEKEYIAVPTGKYTENGTIDKPIYRPDPIKTYRTADDRGDRAITHYFPVKSGEDYSLLLIRLETGRTHQIRVHFAFMGTPLYGDTMYGTADEDIKRQALHCRSLSFIHPVTNEKMTFEAEMPADMLRLLDRLAKN